MIICWWSGGITSAVACKIAIDLFGTDRCRVIMMDTHNEDEDTYRFKADCEKWYGLPIETISAIGDTYKDIQDTWFRHLSLNVANGAICSYMLKRRVREVWQKSNSYDHQIFGFEFDKKEFNRAKSLLINHPLTRPLFPLLMFGLDKGDCVEIVKKAGIVIPRAYRWGLKNNNCLKTGCVQGGIGYWKKIQKEFPDKFDAMALIEHQLTDLKGQPVTMLKDQSNEAKRLRAEDKFGNLVFLKKHSGYPHLKSIDDMAGKEVEPLQDCNGFCGVDDLNPKSGGTDLNFADGDLLA